MPRAKWLLTAPGTDAHRLGGLLVGQAQVSAQHTTSRCRSGRARSAQTQGSGFREPTAACPAPSARMSVPAVITQAIPWHSGRRAGKRAYWSCV